jgi:hypothetical protein
MNGILDGEPFSLDDPNATSHFTLAQFRTLSAGGDIQTPNPNYKEENTNSLPALLDSQTQMSRSQAEAMKLMPKEQSLPGVGAAVGAALIVGGTLAAPTAGGLVTVGMMASMAVGWGVVAVSSPNQASLEYETMKDVKMQESMNEWERMHSMTVQDYIQRRLAAPNAELPEDTPPDWIPAKVLEDDRRKNKEKLYTPWALLPLLLIFFMFRRRKRSRKRKK